MSAAYNDSTCLLPGPWHDSQALPLKPCLSALSIASWGLFAKSLPISSWHVPQTSEPTKVAGAALASVAAGVVAGAAVELAAGAGGLAGCASTSETGNRISRLAARSRVIRLAGFNTVRGPDPRHTLLLNYDRLCSFHRAMLYSPGSVNPLPPKCGIRCRLPQWLDSD